MIASFYWQYTFLLKDDEEKANNMIKHSCELLENASECEDIDIKEGALHILASLYMMTEEYDNALKTTKKLNQKSTDTMLLLATIYQHKGESDRSKKLYQELLFKNLQNSILVLQSLSRILEKESNINDAQLFLETIIKLDTLFEVQNDGEACALQLAELYARNNLIDESISMLKRYVNYINFLTNEGVKGLNNSRFFSEISFKSTNNEKYEFIKQHISYAIVNTPAFDILKDNIEFKSVIEELESL